MAFISYGVSKTKELTMTPDQIHILVEDTIKEIKDLLAEKLKDIHPLQRTLIYARIVNYLYVDHFRTGLLFANEKMRDLELKFIKKDKELENENSNNAQYRL